MNQRPFPRNKILLENLPMHLAVLITTMAIIAFYVRMITFVFEILSNMHGWSEIDWYVEKCINMSLHVKSYFHHLIRCQTIILYG